MAFNLPFRLSQRILFIVALGIAGLLAVGAISLFGKARQARFQAAAHAADAVLTRTDQALVAMLSARQPEKNFQLDRDESALGRHEIRVAEVRLHLQALREMQSSAEVPRLAEDLASGYEDYVRRFAALAATLRQLGLHPEYGLEGAMRASMQEVEAKLKAADQPALMIGMLTLRRHEKDFMLHRDDRSVEAHKAAVEAFQATLQDSPLPPEVKTALAQHIAAYARAFLAWVEGARTLAQEQQAVAYAYAALQPKIDALRGLATESRAEANAVSAEQDGLIHQAIMAAIILATLVVACLAYLVARSIAVPAATLAKHMTAIGRGEVETAVPFRTAADEIGDMARALELLRQNEMERQRLAAAQKASQQQDIIRQERLQDLVLSFGKDIAAINALLDEQVSRMREAASGLASTAAQAAQDASAAADILTEAAPQEAVATAAEERGAAVGETVCPKIAQNAPPAAQRGKDAAARVAALREAMGETQAGAQTVEELSHIIGAISGEIRARLEDLVAVLAKDLGERRNTSRIPMQGTAGLVLRGRRFETSIIDISPTGIRLAAAGDAEPGDRVEVDLGHGARQATVIWSNGSAMGLAFAQAAETAEAVA
jgi:methyl-accepting chemotaxis protein